MAITGAFGAGFAQGFGNAFSESIEKRKASYEKYLDNQLATAKSLAPGYQQATADVNSQIELMDTFETEFGITNEEFVALAQNYDVRDLYSTFAGHKASLPEGVQLRKEDMLSFLSMPTDGAFSLPEGMTPEQALRAMTLGYVEAVNPTDKSDASQMSARASAIGRVLMLNPKAQAEEVVSQMQVLGIPVSELMMYQAAQGQDYNPVAGFGVAPGSLPQYEKYDWQSTQNTYRAIMTRQFSSGAFDDTAAMDEAAVVNSGQAFANLMAEGEAPSNTAELRAILGKEMTNAGIAFADFEAQLVTQGFYSGFNMRNEREAALTRIAGEIDTVEELRKFQAGVKDGSLAKLFTSGEPITQDAIQEYLGDGVTYVRDEEEETTPGEKDQTTEALGGDVPPTEGNESVVSPGATVTTDVAEGMTAPGEDTLDPNLANAGIVGGLKGETGAPKGLMEQAIDTLTGTTPYTEPPSAQELNDEFIASAKEAASNYTWEEYQSMSREERKEAGLPVRPIDSWAAFGVTNPQQYFKGGERVVEAEEKAELAGVSAADILENEEVAKKVFRVAKDFLDDFPDDALSEIDNVVITDYLAQNGYKDPSEALITAFRLLVKAEADIRKTQ